MAVKSTEMRIIFILDYKKNYLLDFISDAVKQADVYLLFYSYPNETSNLPEKLPGKIIYWKDFKNAFSLLKTIKPHKVVFFELETLNQIALNTAARSLDIQSVFCDHGIQELNVSRTANNYSKNSFHSRVSSKVKNIIKAGLLSTWNNRLFFNRTMSVSGREQQQFLSSYKKVRLSNTIHSTRTAIKSKWSDPETLISFCPFNLKYYHQIFSTKNYKEVITGFPEFDEIAPLLPKEKADKKKVLLIDQPYVNNELYGWTRENKIAFHNDVKHKCELTGSELYIKPHPRETSFWREVSGFNMLSQPDFYEILPHTRYVLGFNSTLLLMFAASPAIDVLIFPEHPSGDQVSNILVEEKVAKWFEFSGPLQEIKKTDLKKFENKYLYKLDGSSKDRLTNALIN